MFDKHQRLWVPIALILLIYCGWIAGSAMDIEKYLPRLAPIFLIIGFLTISAIITSMWRVLPKQKPRDFASGWFVALWLALLIAQLVVYPISQRRTISLGNDSEDALIVASTQLLQHHFPYYLHTYLGAPISPMPGAILLAIPFYLIGKVALQNLFWAGVFVVFSLHFFRYRYTALLFLLIIFINAHTFVNLAVGADYPTNCFYICISTYFFLISDESDMSWKRISSIVFLGTALSSRPTYILVIPGLILAYLVQRIGFKAAVYRTALPLCVTAAITAPFYFYDPVHFSPLHVTDRLSFLTSLAQQRMLFITLILFAFGTVCAAFVIRLSVARLFLLASIASGIMLITPGVIWGIRSNFSIPSLTLLGYSDAALCFFCLWAFRYLEEQWA